MIGIIILIIFLFTCSIFISVSESKKKAKIIPPKGWAKIEDKNDGPWSWTEYTDYNGTVFIIYNMMTAPATPGAYMYDKSECAHEFVSTEYSSQIYGHCIECNSTVIRGVDNKWKLP